MRFWSVNWSCASAFRSESLNRAGIVNQPFRVLALGAGFLEHLDGDPGVGNAFLVSQLELRERLLEQHEPRIRIALIDLAANLADVDSRIHQFGGDAE